jgi:predicted XRE-type DNA-binding protein
LVVICHRCLGDQKHEAHQLDQGGEERATGVSHSDFSRIRTANTDRFTLDRLMLVLGKLGQDVELSVTVRPRSQAENQPARVGR